MAGESLRGKVFEKLRNDILRGKYKKGDELVECTIGKEMGVSRTPVREAIRQLELEGLVQLIPNKGAFVTGISSKDVMDMYLIRAKLEGLCAAMAAEHVTEEQLEKMEETILLSDFHVEKGNFEQVCQQDGEFHKLLYEASGSRILAHTLLDFHQYLQRVRMASVRQRKRTQPSTREHKEILEAIRKKDASAADRAAYQHIVNTIENLKNFSLDEVLKEEMK
nr:GntR family transcriptional regulator [uncultured Blautia sp.]